MSKELLERNKRLLKMKRAHDIENGRDPRQPYVLTPEKKEENVFRVCDLYPGRWPNDKRKVKLIVVDGKSEIHVIDEEEDKHE